MQATITLLAGDGIGPEVMAVAARLLRVVGERFGHAFELPECLIGGAAMDAVGEPLPLETIANCKNADAVLLGAVGGPKWDDPLAKTRPEQGLLGIRKELRLFANVRPIRVSPFQVERSPLRPEIVKDVDFVVFRELTGGIYFGPRGREPQGNGTVAHDTMVYSTPEVDRVVRRAAKLAQTRKGKLTSVDKANVLESSRLWRESVTRLIEHEFPDVEVEHLLVDATAMHLITNPRRFDVIVTGNMFGDILTDEASVIPGSIGLLPSASLGDGKPGLFEPVHGSAPDIAGQNKANPLGMVLSMAMMLRDGLELSTEAAAVENAVDNLLEAGHLPADLCPPGQTPKSTSEIADLLEDQLKG